MKPQALKTLLITRLLTGPSTRRRTSTNHTLSKSRIKGDSSSMKCCSNCKMCLSSENSKLDSSTIGHLNLNWLLSQYQSWYKEAWIKITCSTSAP